MRPVTLTFTVDTAKNKDVPHRSALESITPQLLCEVCGVADIDNVEAGCIVLDVLPPVPSDIGLVLVDGAGIAIGCVKESDVVVTRRGPFALSVVVQVHASIGKAVPGVAERRVLTIEESCLDRGIRLTAADKRKSSTWNDVKLPLPTAHFAVTAPDATDCFSDGAVIPTHYGVREKDSKTGEVHPMWKLFDLNERRGDLWKSDQFKNVIATTHSDGVRAYVVPIDEYKNFECTLTDCLTPRSPFKHGLGVKVVNMGKGELDGAVRVRMTLVPPGEDLPPLWLQSLVPVPAAPAVPEKREPSAPPAPPPPPPYEEAFPGKPPVPRRSTAI